MDPNNRLIIVTGASSGIGAATARQLGRAGATVVLMARTASKLEELAFEIGAAGGTAVAVPVDLGDPAAVQAACDGVLESHGVPDAIINNAGAGRFLAVDETPMEEAVQMMAAPYFAAFFVTRAFLPKMIERGSGVILNVNSPVSRVVWPGSTGYAAARWAIRGFTHGLRGDVRGTGLKVVEYVAGEVSSEYFANNAGAGERLPSITNYLPVMAPDQAAEGLIGALRSERKVVFKPFVVGLLAASAWLTPPIIQWVVDLTGWKRG